MKYFPVFLRRLVNGLLGTLFAAATAFAAPGAHGPNGEHLDAPAASGGAINSAPRFEAQSDMFEVVGRLQGGEFSMLINRFATNEPVLDAKVEIESGALKAQARFHADLGDYAVDDAAMLKALSLPGEHPLVITVLAGTEADLLDGSLRVTAAAEAHGHGASYWVGGALAVAVFLAAGFYYSRRSKSPRTPGMGAVQ
ncbi:hypothetical protein [Polaromonas sp.]|uniref:hypothetical protein n=1 Tax=Polaromonas sp. TaxID=1869339 RepID=UPI003751FCD6